MTHQAPAPKTPAPGKSRGMRLAIGLAVVLGVIVVYALSLFGVNWLATSVPPLPEPDLGTTEDTVVQVRVEKLETVSNRLTVSVLVIPEDSKFDKRLDVLTQDLAVRLYPENDLGDLQYPVGKSPAQVSTQIEADGDPAHWPFDSYATGVISADVIVGTGENRVKEPARVEVIGSLDGWDISVQRVGESSQTTSRPDNVIITLHRARGTLIFDLGIILVLVSLPTLALWVSIPMVLGRKKFLPPFVSWFAAMLFAVVPLRNILPGNPPPGALIDQAITLWVLIALIVAMTLFIVAYRRQSD